MKLLVLFLLVIFALPAFASENGPTWKYVEFGYVEADVDGIEIEPSGFSAEFSTLLNENIFLMGSYGSVSEDFVDFNAELELTQFELGVGYRVGVTDSSDFAVGLSYIDAEVCGSAQGVGSECIDDNGYGVTLGFRSMLTEQFEFFIGLGYVDIYDDSETTTGLGVAYNFTDAFAVKLSLATADDVDEIGISARFQF